MQKLTLLPLLFCRYIHIKCIIIYFKVTLLAFYEQHRKFVVDYFRYQLAVAVLPKTFISTVLAFIGDIHDFEMGKIGIIRLFPSAEWL